MTEHYHPARLLGYRSLGYVYCRHCATEAFADSGDAILTTSANASHLVCYCCGRHLTPAPSLDHDPAPRVRIPLPTGGEVIA